MFRSLLPLPLLILGGRANPAFYRFFCPLALARCNQWTALVEDWRTEREKPGYFFLALSASHGISSSDRISCWANPTIVLVALPLDPAFDPTSLGIEASYCGASLGCFICSCLLSQFFHLFRS